MKPNTQHPSVDNITQRLSVLAQRVDQLTKGQRKFSRSRDKNKISPNYNPSDREYYEHFKLYATRNKSSQNQTSSMISVNNTSDQHIESSNQKIIDELTKKVNNLVATVSKSTQFLQTQISQIRQQLHNISPKSIQLSVPKLSNKDQEALNDQILNWLDTGIYNLFDTCYNSRNRSKNLSELQVSFSQHILTNIFKLTEQISLTPQLFRLINSHLKQKTLPYLLQKYSKKQSINEINYIGDILVRDQLYDSQYDLCGMSGIDFFYKQNGNYNQQIMKFLNFVIQFPNKFKQAENSNTFYEGCCRQISDILEKIQIPSFAIDMFKYNHTSSNQKNDQILSPKSQKYPSMEQIQYKQKIKSYTKYFCHKNYLNSSLYTKAEIQKGILICKNQQILKFIANWCEELQKYFYQNIYFQKSNVFRMKDSSCRYLKVSELNALQALFNKQKKHLKQQTKVLLIDIYQNQSQTSQQPLLKQLKNLINNEGKLGQFVSAQYRSYQVYLTRYLNLLIHGINRVLDQFEKFQRVQRQYPSIFANFVGEYDQQKSLKKSIRDTQNFLQFLREPHKCLSQTPQLIKFHKKDTLVFECISKQSQIFNLYKYFEYQNSTNPKFIKILKIVETLSSSTSPEHAITLNLLYKQSLIIEIKLNLVRARQEYENFIKYYINGLVKEQFGPIMRMCVILAQNDSKSKYFLNVIEKNNINYSHIQHQANYSYVKSPAKQLQSSYPDTKNYPSYVKYRKLNLSETNKIHINSLSKNYPMLQLLNLNKNLINQINYNDICSWTSTLKQLNLSQNFLQNIDGIYGLESLVSLDLSSNRIFQISSKIDNLKRLEKLDLSKNNLTTLDVSFKSMDKLKILNLQDNQIKNLSTLQIKNLIQLNIGHNYLETFPQQIGTLANLKKLKLNNNKIFELSNQIRNLTQLQQFNISQNNFVNFPVDVCALPRLKQLDISYNSVTHLVKEIAAMSSLKLLNISFNKINSVQLIGKLSALQVLNASFNQIIHIHEKISQLENLNSLDLSNNLIINIPHQIGNIKKLTVLNLRGNKITKIPEQLSQLGQLISLNLSMNLIDCLPTNFINLRNLQKLNLSKNDLEGLPASFDNFAKLIYFNAQRNNIKDLPESFANIRNLKHVHYIGNSVKKIPENLLNLTSLQTLQISALNIDDLPKLLQNWHNLQELSLESVQKQKSQKIEQIQSLCSQRNILFYYSQISKNKFQ